MTATKFAVLAALSIGALMVGDLTASAAPDTPAATYGGDRVAGRNFAGRSAVVAPNGAAATAHPLATQTAINVLKAGGTAVDAAIAANAMLGLVEPTGNGIGGDLFALVWDPKSEKLYGLNASGRSPMGLSIETVRAEADEKGKGRIPPFGAAAVSVPGAVSGWGALHERFGRLAMADILASPIAYAEAGAPIPEVIAYYWGRSQARFEQVHESGMLQEVANARATFWPDGAPTQGALFKNPDLAKTYRTIAEGGAQAFYEGPIADAMDAYMRRIGGWLRKEDLAAHTADWVDPYCVPYREATVCGLGQNTQGVSTLQILSILEGFDMKAAGFMTAESLHLQIEAKRLAYADRARGFYDPDFAAQDQTRLLDPDYIAGRRAMIDPDRAIDTVGPGASVLAQNDTTYLSVADKDGMMVSLIQSNFRGMGSGLVPDGLGFMFQNRGELFSLESGHPNVYAPGKRPFHTIIPGFAFRDGKPWLAFGVMGGDMQPQGQAQIIINMIDYGLGLQEAGDAARWRHAGDLDPDSPSGDNPRGYVELESGVPAETRAALEALGHEVRDGAGAFGGYQAVMRDFAHGTWIAATEMRKDGSADGY